MQEDVHQQAEKYRSLGYQETDVEIQELQKKWFGYRDNIISIYDDILNKRLEGLQIESKLSEGNIEKQISLNREMAEVIKKSISDQTTIQGIAPESNEIQALYSQLADLDKDYLKLVESGYAENLNVFKKNIEEKQYWNELSSEELIKLLQEELEYTDYNYSQRQKQIEEWLNKDIINYNQYLALKEGLDKQYTKSREEIIRESFETENQMYQDAIDSMNEYISQLEEAKQLAKESSDKEIKVIQDKIDGLKAYYSELDRIADAQKKEAEFEKRYAKIKEDDLKFQEEQEKRLLKINEKQLEMDKKRLELEKTKQEKNIQQLQEIKPGEFQYTYVEDQEKIDKLEEDISKLESDLGGLQQEYIDAEIKQAKDRAETLLQIEQDRIEYDEELRRNAEIAKLEAEKKALEDEYTLIENGYNDQIDLLKGHVKAVEQKQKEHYGKQKLDLEQFGIDIKEIDAKIYNDRLKDLSGFVDLWNAEIARMASSGLDDMQASDLKQSQTLSISSYAPRLASGGKIKQSGLAVVHEEERVLPKEITSTFDKFTDSLSNNGIINKLMNFVENLAPNIIPSNISGVKSNNSNLSSITNSNSSQVYNISNLNVNCPEVKDGNDFMFFVKNTLPLLAAQKS